MKKKQKQSEKRKNNLRKRAEELLLAEKSGNLDGLSKTDIKNLIHELQVHQIELEMQNEELRRAQLELEESRNRYADLYDFAPVGYFTLSEKGIILEVNLTGAALLGVERKNLIKRAFSRCIASEGRDEFYFYRKQLLGTDTRQTLELKMLRKDGTPFYAQLEGIAILDDEGNFSRFQMAVLDVTERRQAEERLSDEKERLAVTLRSIGDGVIATNKEGRIVLINIVAETLTGLTQEEAVGRPINEVFHTINENTRQGCENPVEKVLTTGGEIIRLTDDTVLIARDGTERIIAGSAAPIHGKESTIIGVVLVFRDITEKIKMEREILTTRRLESVGVLAGGIAHDFNNLLTAILGNVSLARMYAKPEDKIFERLMEAEKATLRATGLTQQLLTFAKGGAPVKKTASIGELLKDSASFALRGSNVRCEFSIPEVLWPVEVDEGQMSQVINNLIINAQQAMPEGGIIKLSAENITLEAGHEYPLMKDGEYIKITIEDQGVGIPKEYLQKIFDPYFTTKQKGSGLGLTIAYSIVKNHDGYIWVESEAGVETTFYIYLPASEKEIPIKKELEESPLLMGKGKILVMDDEEIVRDFVAKALTSIGYKVEFAGDGAEAIELYKKAGEWGQPFDAVILDLTVPGGIGGKKAIKRLVKIDPNVKAIVSSGYSNDPIMAKFKEYGFKGVIAKPYKIEKLSQVLHRVIGGLEEPR